ncbi:hypothetical protein LSH36_41g12006 [Paralvinella palmiformis]|uniref:Peptidase metallopeptidase domain-containing protein n=1 Tax=Paralvinella palmiformis TaxID=53620 RepID=A0AAD9K7B6_9ANNE|nr:hypothetical protein LSH36_41g12006 [Paralvinella palmiformis]
MKTGKCNALPWILVNIIVVISLANGKTRTKPVGQKVKDIDPDLFLMRYGYLGEPPKGISHSPAARKEAIKNFQRMVGLKVTGLLDKSTRTKMAAPRCGMPDMVPPGSYLPPPGVALDPGTNPQNFYVPGYKWNKTDLTWMVHNFSPDLNTGSQRRAFYNALKYWSDVTPLTFNEVAATNADIKIKFARGEHGDGVGNAFDGPGGILAHAFYPENGDTHFDEDELWTQYTNDGTNLEIVAAHELGHALGLGHSNVPNALMAPYYQGYKENFQLHQDDIWAIQTLYGGATAAPTNPPLTTTTTTESPSGGDPNKDPCQTKFGAIFQGHDSRIYVINNKYIYRLNDLGLEEGYPKRLSKVYERAPYHTGAAAYSWRTRFTYLFKGKKVFKYYGFSRIQKKYVTSPGYPSKVDAAFIGRDGYIYLFKGSEYWIFDEARMDVKSPNGKPISSMWPGMPPNIGAAVRLRDGYIYFFKGERYRKYDEYYKRVLPGYPKNKAAPWMGKVCGGVSVPK